MRTRPWFRTSMILALGAVLGVSVTASAAGGAIAQLHSHAAQLPNDFPLLNGSGFAATYSTNGFVDFTTPFHEPLGTNGRSCGTCHLPASGWSITPGDANWLFLLTAGKHPLFRTPEANNPAAPLATIRDRKNAYSMLLTKAVFRRTFKVPAGAEFKVLAFDDPYGVATTTELSLFRRPLASTNFHLVNGIAQLSRDVWIGIHRNARAPDHDGFAARTGQARGR